MSTHLTTPVSLIPLLLSVPEIGYFSYTENWGNEIKLFSITQIIWLCLFKAKL